MIAVTFKDEGKDVLGDVLKDPNRQAISGDTGTHFEPVAEQPPPQEQPPTPTPTPVATETAPPPPPTISTSTAPPPETSRTFAGGKFKTAEDMEKAYTELEKGFHAKAREAAELKKVAVTPVVTPEETETERLERINQFLADPDAYASNMAKKVAEQTEKALATQRETAEHMSVWAVSNKDLDNPKDKFRIAAEVYRLTQADPELDPWAAFEQATTNHRAYIGEILDMGRKEALSVQGSVTQTSEAKVLVPPPTEQAAKPPMTDQDAFNAHLANLSAESARVRRVAR